MEEENVQPPVISFNASSDRWFMKITEHGFLFNREDYPEATIDEFAKAFIELLERQFVVKFEKRKM